MTSGSWVAAEASANVASGARERLRAALAGWMGEADVSVVLDALDEDAVGTLLARVAEAGGFSPSERVLMAALARQSTFAVERARLLRVQGSAALDRDNVLATVVHDLRTPLSTISMTIAGILRSPPGERVDRVRAEGERVLRNVRRMNQLIRDLLDFSRIGVGRLRVDVGVHLLGDLLDEAVRPARPLAAERRLELVIHAADDRVQVACDRERTLQVLASLLDNAIKFTEPGGAIRVRAMHVDGDIVVEVQDDGRGIAAENLARAFEPRAQAGDHKRASREGVGLGLFIARAVIEAQGGRIWVESNPGRGSRFSFTMRAANRLGASVGSLTSGNETLASAVSGVMPVVFADGHAQGGRSGANR